MRSTGSNPHCQPCENLKHWIEIVVRDEHNQPFERVSGVLIDAMKNKHSFELGSAPILIENLAPGPVEIQLDYDQWLKAAQDKSHPRNEEKINLLKNVLAVTVPTRVARLFIKKLQQVI